MSLHKFIVLMYVYALAAWLFTVCAKAEDSYQLYRLPEGSRIAAQGNTYQGFSLSEYKLLLRMDADLKASDAELRLRLSELSALRANLEDLQKLVTLTEGQVVKAEAEVERKDKLVDTLSKKNIELFEKLETRKRFIRIIGGVAGSLVGGVILGFMIAK